MRNEKINTLKAIRVGALLSFLPRGIIYNSRTSSRIHSELGYRADKAIIIENGFDLDHFRPMTGKKKGNFTVALIGRFHPMKNHKLFYEVASTLSPNYPAVKFLMAGRGVLEGNNWGSHWTSKGLSSQNLSIEDEIKVDAGVFSRIDLLVLCSSWGEAFPNIVGEAMACGVPCVVTDVGDSGVIVGDSGVVVPIGNHQELYKGIEYFINLGKDAYQEKSLRARKLVEDKFSLKAIVTRYRNLYQI